MPARPLSARGTTVLTLRNTAMDTIRRLGGMVVRVTMGHELNLVQCGGATLALVLHATVTGAFSICCAGVGKLVAGAASGVLTGVVVSARLLLTRACLGCPLLGCPLGCPLGRAGRIRAVQGVDIRRACRRGHSARVGRPY